MNKFLQLDPLVFTEVAYSWFELWEESGEEGSPPVRWSEFVDAFIDHFLPVETYSWFELWEESGEEGSPPVRWSEFVDAFIDHFLPVETKAARATEFESLKQGSMSVWDYHMRFVCLSKYAIYMLPPMKAKVRRFVQGLSPLVINEAATAALNSDMNYRKMVAFAQATQTRKMKNRIEREGSNKARSAGSFGGSSNGGSGGRSAYRGGSSRPSQSFAQSLVTALPSGCGPQ
ncbi:uncharacterized protein [Nicotiana tomentosiformis]|uniref:uncharacterized protein n=1 Tax=Nicotiana tomentosiformis TaxID=4098 RepID=UPI00388C8CCD